MLMASLTKWQPEDVTQSVVARGLAHEFKDWRLDSMLDAVDQEVDKILSEWRGSHGGEKMCSREEYLTRMAILSRHSTDISQIVHVQLAFKSIKRITISPFHTYLF